MNQARARPANPPSPRPSRAGRAGCRTTGLAETRGLHGTSVSPEVREYTLAAGPQEACLRGVGALPDFPHHIHLRAYQHIGQLSWGGPGSRCPSGRGASPKLRKPDGHPVLWVSEVSEETMEEVITQHQVRFLRCAIRLNPSRCFNMPISQVDRDDRTGC